MLGEMPGEYFTLVFPKQFGREREKGNLISRMIQGLWDRPADTIIDVILSDPDTDSYKYEPIAALLAWWETIKKNKHFRQFHDQRKHFYLFVLSVNGMLGGKALVLL